MYQRKSTTGFATVDRAFDDLIAYINRMGGSTGATGAITQYPITTEGGFYIAGINGMGYKLQRGVLVKASTTDTQKFIICNEDNYNVSGIIYEDSNPGEACKVIVSGYAQVYFNSNGATMGDYFRMSKTADTVNTDTGKAQSQSTKPDALWLKGFVHQSVVGSGLALCSILR